MDASKVGNQTAFKTRRTAIFSWLQPTSFRFTTPIKDVSQGCFKFERERYNGKSEVVAGRYCKRSPPDR